MVARALPKLGRSPTAALPPKAAAAAAAVGAGAAAAAVGVGAAAAAVGAGASAAMEGRLPSACRAPEMAGARMEAAVPRMVSWSPRACLGLPVRRGGACEGGTASS